MPRKQGAGKAGSSALRVHHAGTAVFPMESARPAGLLGTSLTTNEGMTSGRFALVLPCAARFGEIMLDVDYRPRDPQKYNPPIALVGCGGITEYHLSAYQTAGYDVVALCDLRRDLAEDRAREFFPQADIYTDYQDVLRRDDVEVVDIATHPPERPSIVRDALMARKHVLSQKPFVLDLDEGEKLVDLAHTQNVKLAVNQNGRWAPHFSYARAAVAAGLLGDVAGVHLSVHWDHTWTAGTEFEKVKHLILYDFAVHWFDMVNCLVAHPPKRVFASMAERRDKPSCRRSWRKRSLNSNMHKPPWRSTPIPVSDATTACM